MASLLLTLPFWPLCSLQEGRLGKPCIKELSDMSKDAYNIEALAFCCLKFVFNFILLDLS